MNALKKEEMALYLHDYANIIASSQLEETTPIIEIFRKYMISRSRLEDCNELYFKTMFRVVRMYYHMKEFSLVEDYLLNRDDYISNLDLDGIDKDIEFKTPRGNISNKKIVQLIRNAFNHNDSDATNRFKVSINGRYCEIDLKDIRTQSEKESSVLEKPFIIKFKADALNEMTNILNNASQNLLYISFKIPDDFDFFAKDINKEINKLKMLWFYKPRKMSKEDIKLIQDYKKQSNDDPTLIDEMSKKIREEIDSQGHMLEEVELDYNQKNRVIDYMSWYRNQNVLSKEFINSNTHFMMYYILMQSIPIPPLKVRWYIEHILISTVLGNNPNYSWQSIHRLALDIRNEETKNIKNTEQKEIYDYISESLETSSNKTRFFMDVIDGAFYAGLPLINYIEYVVTNVYNDAIITINGVDYPKDRIRNSFAHGRWILKGNLDLVLYDADPRDINMNKLDYIATINVIEFKNWADLYMKNIMKKGRGR